MVLCNPKLKQPSGHSWSFAIQRQHDLLATRYPNKQKKQLGGHQVVPCNVMLKQPIGHQVAK